MISRTNLFSTAFTLALIAPLFAACTDVAVDDEFATEETADLDESKADLGGTYTYYEVFGDARRCASPYCGGNFVKRVNHATTRCADGRLAERCYVASTDFARLGLSEAALDQVRGAVGYVGETRLVMRGTIGKRNWGVVGLQPEFRPSEAWVGQGPNAADGPFAKVEDAGIRCITTPCPSLREKKLNSSATAMLSELGWDASGATEDQITKGVEELFANGIIIAGDRYNVRGAGGTGKARTVTQFYSQIREAATTTPAN